LLHGAFSLWHCQFSNNSAKPATQTVCLAQAVTVRELHQKVTGLNNNTAEDIVELP
jgi:hypothetical protein